MGENKLDKDDAADLTDATASQVSEAWHVPEMMPSKQAR